MELRTIIVDDEMPAREELRFLISSYPQIKLVGEASSGKEAIRLAESLSPDVIFLDIKMWDLNGFETAKGIFEKGINPFIIFATAYDEYAVKAFEINAVDYILKPVTKKDWIRRFVVFWICLKAMKIMLRYRNSWII